MSQPPHCLSLFAWRYCSISNYVKLRVVTEKMSFERALELIKSAKNPARSIDATIARSFGWQQQPENVIKGGVVKQVHRWVDAKGATATVPFFTSNLDAAFRLSQTLVPSHVAALLWDKREYTAQFKGGEKYSAPDPALALCYAALSTYIASRPPEA